MRNLFNEDLVQVVRESESVTFSVVSLSELKTSEDSISLDEKLTGEACTTTGNVMQDDELLDDNVRKGDEMF